MGVDEDYSSQIMDTAPADFDDTRSIASSVSYKKPLYKRAWRKVYKTITAPEKDASGQRISIRESLSMRLSRDTSVSSSSSSFFAGLRTPRSARHPTSRSEFALSETHTAPLPMSSSGGSPTRGPMRTPYTVENAVSLPLPTDEEKRDKPDSARDLHPSLASANASAGQSQVPALHTEDMSLSQLVGRTDDTMTPVTSARVGSVDSTPMKAPAEAPAAAPQISAASLLHADDTRSSLHPNSAREEPTQNSMPKRQPDRHVESQDEPFSKQSLCNVQRPYLSSDAPMHTSSNQLEKSYEDIVIAADSVGMSEQQYTLQRSHHTSSPRNRSRRSVSKLKQLRLASRGNAAKLADVSPVPFQQKLGGGCQDSANPQCKKPTQPAQPVGNKHQNVPDLPTDLPQGSCEPSASISGLETPAAAETSMIAPADSIPKHGTPNASLPSNMQALADSKAAECKADAKFSAADASPQAQHVITASLPSAIESENVIASTQAADSPDHPIDDSATPACPALPAASEHPLSDNYTSVPAFFQPSSQPPQPGRTITSSSDSMTTNTQVELSQTANNPASPGTGQLMSTIAGSTLGAMPSLPTTPMLYSETPCAPDSASFDSTFMEESEASSGPFFVAKDALVTKSLKPSQYSNSVCKSAQGPLVEGRGQPQSLHTFRNHNVSSVTDHGCSARTAAAAAELHGVSVELPDSYAKPMPTSVQDGMRTDILDVGTGKSPGQGSASDHLPENVNAVDFVEKSLEGASVDLQVDPADDETAESDSCANPVSTGPHSDTLESSVRDLVCALEEHLTTSGTLEGAISGDVGPGDSKNGTVGASNDRAVGTSECTGSISGLEADLAGNSVSAKDMIEKFESEQPRNRHIFNPSPKKTGNKDSAHGDHEDAQEASTSDDKKQVHSKGGRKVGGAVRVLAKVVMVAAVGAGATFAVARAR